MTMTIEQRPNETGGAMELIIELLENTDLTNPLGNLAGFTENGSPIVITKQDKRRFKVVLFEIC